MANTKISALSSGNPAQGTDLIPIDRAGANFSITPASIVGAGVGPVVATTTVTAGANGGTAGAVNLNGSTSGTASITAPAIAGTSTNGLIVTNNVLLPNGTAAAPAYSFSSATGAGLFVDGSGEPIISKGGVARFGVVTTGVQIPVASGYQWSSTTVVGVADTGLSRDSAGVIDVGNGTSADKSGSINLTNLTASGTVRANTGFSANGTPGVTSTPAAPITAITVIEGIVTAITGTSDARLKTNIKPFSKGLDAVLAITPKTYTWNEAGQKISNIPSGFEQVGFIAQNVQTVIPEAIGKEGEYLTLDTRAIMAALVNAVHELSARVVELENK